MTQLRPKQAPGIAEPLWPRIKTHWISALVKTAADEAVNTDGRRALQTVGHLVEQRRDLNETFRDALNQCLGLIGRLERREAETSTVLDSLVERFDQLDKAVADLSSQIAAFRSATPPADRGEIFSENLIQALLNGQAESNRGLERSLDEIRELLQASLDDATRERQNAQPGAFKTFG